MWFSQQMGEAIITLSREGKIKKEKSDLLHDKPKDDIHTILKCVSDSLQKNIRKDFIYCI